MLLREERMRQLKERWKLEDKSAILLQSHARKLNAKKYIKQKKTEQVSAIKLQQYARRFITRSNYLKQLKRYHEKRNVSTVLIQSIMRMYLMKCPLNVFNNIEERSHL